MAGLRRLQECRDCSIAAASRPSQACPAGGWQALPPVDILSTARSGMQALRRSPRLRQLPTAPIPPTPPIPPTAPIPQTPPAMHNLGLFDNEDRKSTRLNSSHLVISYAVFCLKKTTAHRERIPN